MNSWILVADNAHARIFNAETEKPELNEIENMIHPESRQHEQKLTSDLPGIQAGIATGNLHRVEGKTDPKDYKAVEFAREICEYLESAHNAQKFHRLIIVAAPSFLGLLRKELSNKVNKVVTLEIDKDIVGQSPNSIRKHLLAILP